jgi:O-methyltransferase involved in polyketide biosynthesis
VILTEGVLPYLTPEQVAELAQDLHEQTSFTHWIADYIAPIVYKYLQSPKRAAKMKNAPFLFMPPDWLGFFESRGWHPATLEYLPEEGYKLGRQVPAPWFMKFVVPFLKDKTKRQFLHSSGYMIMERK